ncbi:MAG: NAD+ synthase [Legionella sp.]|nr:NAD+ synthase [Legionella sp.]
MTQKLTVLMAQFNPVVGAINANVEKIIAIIRARQATHDVIVFPELAISGYPPEDLLLRKAFHQEIEDGLQKIAEITENCHVIIGHPSLIDGQYFNSASVFYKNKRVALYHKQTLPNYGVFDEARYFISGEPRPCILTIKGYQIGVCICEDIWGNYAVDQIVNAGATILFCINASPFDDEKHSIREELVRTHAKRGLTIIYVNTVGGQDELLFDGQSLAMDKTGKVCARAHAFVEDFQTVIIEKNQVSGEITPLLDADELIYKALVYGTREYVEKNHFPGVLVGLSGGIDSALTLAIAVDALGAQRVHAVMMPSRYTADMSNDDAEAQIVAMQVKSTLLPIEPVFKTFLDTLAPSFAGLPNDTTEENIQARIRGVLLMALSNKTGYMVLTTSNKSETAVGYATLYGDMAGGFAVLKDVLKTQVYALARYRNSLGDVIPSRVLTRAPSAELKENQTDQDSLPDYAVLDAIITLYMQKNLDAKAIIEKGFDAIEVNKILRLIKRNEYKRRQAAPGIKISPRAFGRDWRMPITSGFNP